MEPLGSPFPERPEHFQLDGETRKLIEDNEARATLDFLDGWRQGNEEGYNQGLEVGWRRGRDDILHQLRRYAQHSYDPDVQRAIEDITGESSI